MKCSPPIGAGGVGEVYRARDTRLGRELGRELAIKVLPADLEWSATQTVELSCVLAVSHGTLPMAALPRGASVTLSSPWRARRLPGAPSGIR
jgi:hypothetical protein